MTIFLFLSLVLQIPDVCASSTAGAKIGNNYFDTLEEAINVASSTDTITLTNNISLEKTLEINKTVNINLNNHTIETKEKVFVIQGGSLNLTGNGVIRETRPNYGAIMILGSDDPTKKDYSTISVGSGITLEGWSGIFINHYNKTAYGVLVNMNGVINAVDDISGGSGIGIYVNGNIQHKDNSPIINLSNTAKITSTGNGIYAAGYATYNINGAYISGVESGLGIKSGVFNILDGTIIGTGENKTPTTGNSNGINPSGTAIQIESNTGYTGNIELNIKSGTIESKNSYAVYEYTTGKSSTQVKSIDISGGMFSAKKVDSVFLLSDSFKNTHPKFISGGAFSSDPTAYLKSGYSVSLEQPSLYSVISSTMNVFNDNIENFKNNLPIIFGVISIFVLAILFITNRNKILNLIKK